MSQFLISVVWVNWRSRRYIEPLYAQLVRLATDPQRIRFLIVDNTNGEDRDIAAFAQDHGLELVENDPGTLTRSWAHSNGLDRGAALVETPFTLVLDPDVAVMKAGWDALLLKLIAPPDVAAVGAPYPFWKLGKYHDFPSPIFCFFDTATVRALGTGWKPFADSVAVRGWHRVLRQFVRLFGLATRRNLSRYALLRTVTGGLERTLGVCGPDTGWKIAEACRHRRLRSVLFKEENEVSSPLLQSPDLKSLVETFEVFTWNSEPVLAHKYSSRSRMWRTPESHDLALWERLTRKIAR